MKFGRRLGVLVGVIVEITLHQNDRSALITGAGGQVAQRADQVRQAAGGSALRALPGVPHLIPFSR